VAGRQPHLIFIATTIGQDTVERYTLVSLTFVVVTMPESVIAANHTAQSKRLRAAPMNAANLHD
jgi:hypothetical protein